MAYATLETLKAYTGIAAATVTDDTLLRDLLERASKAIDTYTGRHFDGRTATRYYESGAVDGYTLYLDQDLISVTTLTNGDDDATTIPSTEYWLIDRNEGPPYYAIRLESLSDYTWEFDQDKWVSVLGVWGWSLEPPEDITHACVRLTAFYYAQKDAQVFDVTAVPEAGVITVPQGIPRDVERLLEKYKYKAPRKFE